MDYTRWTTALEHALATLAERAGDLLPRALTAGILLLAGWLLARLLRTWTARGLARLGRLVDGRPTQSLLRRVGIERPVAELLGAVVYWGVLLLFVTAATDALGLPLLATWLAAASYHLPRILLAILVLIAGVLLGNLGRDAARAAATAAGIAHDALIGRLVQALVVVIALVTAVDQVGVDIRFLTTIILLAVGAGSGSVALAFALGARTAVANIIACHYLRQTHRLGDVVRVGGVQGRIVEFTSSAVILEGGEGRMLVPAKEFSEGVSLLVEDR